MGQVILIKSSGIAKCIISNLFLECQFLMHVCTLTDLVFHLGINREGCAMLERVGGGLVDMSADLISDAGKLVSL